MQKEIVRGICLETRTVTFFTHDTDVEGSYYHCVNCNKLVTHTYHIFNPSDELKGQLLDYWYGNQGFLNDSDIPNDDDEDEEWRSYDLH